MFFCGSKRPANRINGRRRGKPSSSSVAAVVAAISSAGTALGTTYRRSTNLCQYASPSAELATIAVASPPSTRRIRNRGDAGYAAADARSLKTHGVRVPSAARPPSTSIWNSHV